MKSTILYALFVTVVFAVTTLADDGAFLMAVQNEYLVTVKTHPSSISAVALKTQDVCDCLIRRRFTFDDTHILHIEGSWEKVMKLKALPEVAVVERNMIVQATRTTTNATVHEQKTGRELWGLSRIGRRDPVSNDDATYKWGTNDDGFGVDAYILDTGIDVTHPDFEGRATWGYTAQAIKDQGEKDEDLNGHGTLVAGTVGGKTYGVAKRVNLIAVKVLNRVGDGSAAGIVEGFEYAYNSIRTKETTTGKKAKVVLNLSFSVKGKVVAFEHIIDEAVEAGMVVVVAAGNDFDDACNSTFGYIATAVTVGATNINDELSVFSNYGECVAILAPGEDIRSTLPGNAAGISSGTSMACAHVAGAVARYLSRFDEPPSPAMMKQKAKHVATMDKINMEVGNDPEARLATPNMLLYIPINGAGMARFSTMCGVIMILALLAQ